MKKIFSILTILMFLMSFVVIAEAPPVPAPIRGYFEVNGQGLAGYIIEAQNLRTNEVISGDTIPSMVTEPNGFAFDLSKFSQGAVAPIPGVYVGDVIEVRVRGFGEEGKIQFNVPSSTPYTITIEITTTQELFQCYDGSWVLDQADCPDIPTTTTTIPTPEPESKVISSEDGKSAYVESYYGQEIDICITDSKITSLIDTEIEYDDEDYDVHEEVCLKGIVLTSLDDEAFGLEPYFTIAAGDIVYKYIFEDAVPLEDIHIEEPLEITLLGEDYSIIEATSNEITVRFGTELGFNEGDTKVVDGTEITVIAVMEESVSVKVNSITETIYDGDTEQVGDLEISVDEIIYQGYAEGVKHTVLIVGDKVEDTYKDGDDFELFIEDDEEFKWVIDLPGYIGVVNQEEYKEIEDEDYKAIGVGGSISLPNSYLSINFKQITESDVVDLTFKVDDGYLNVRGPEDAFADEFDEVNVNADGIYDEDEVLIATNKVRIGDSDTYLELGSVKIGKLEILLDLSDILYDGISYALEDGNFLDYFGIIFRDAENAVDDQSGFKVSVPEERPEATISISTEAIVIEPTTTTTTIPKEETTTTTVPPVVTTTTIIPPTTTTTIPDDEEEDEPSNLQTILITLIATIIGLFAWGKGFAGLIKYYLRLADKTNDKELAKKYRARAEKMARTVITNFLAGKYKK